MCSGRFIFLSWDEKFVYVVSASEPNIVIVDLKEKEVVATLKDKGLFADTDISEDRRFLLTNIKSKKSEISVWDMQERVKIKRFDGFC